MGEGGLVTKVEDGQAWNICGGGGWILEKPISN
jgi:hypothetical protein